MHKPQSQVQEFHKRVANAPVSPASPELRTAVLRARLILEETIETIEALIGTDKASELVRDASWKLDGGDDNNQRHNPPSLVETIDGLCDLLYVAYGTAEAIGVDLEPFYDEVHHTNMQKEHGPVDANGKKLKPPGWKPPRIAELLKLLHNHE